MKTVEHRPRTAASRRPRGRPERALAATWLLAGALGLGGCVSEVDLEGLPCPCIGGFVCDPVDQVCRPPGAARDAGPSDLGPADTGPADVGSDPLDGGTPDRGEPSDGPVGDVDGGYDCTACLPDQACLDNRCVVYVDLETYFDINCGVLERGQVACWGAATDVYPRPTLVSGVDDAERVVITDDTICALRRGGAVSCWYPGTAMARTATEILFDGPVKDLRGGAGYWCALLEDGRLQCLGRNDDGQFGTSTPTSAATATTITLDPPIDDIKRLFGQWAYTCLVHGSSSHKVTCFGPSYGGRTATQELGRVRSWDAAYGLVLTTDDVYLVDVDRRGFRPIANGRPVTAVGGSCRLFADGSLDCRQAYGLSGYPPVDRFGVSSDSSADFIVPTASISSDIVQIGDGPWHGCMLSADGVIRCLGHDEYGQVGAGRPRPLHGRYDVPRLRAGSGKLVAGLDAACALHSGALSCWGRNRRQLGRGGRELSPRPVNLEGAVALDAVLFGPFDETNHGLAVLVQTSSTTEVRIFGETALATVPASDGSPTTWRTVTALAGATRLAGADDEICGQLRDGSVRCLLDGAVVDVPSFQDATSFGIDMGGRYRVAVVGGALVCSPKGGACPSDLTMPAPVSEVVAGNAHGLARLVDGRLLRFGPHPTIGAPPGATLVPGIIDAVGVSAGPEHVCVVQSSGQSRCWGSNEHEQVAPGDLTQRFAPSQSYLLDAEYDAVVAGGDFSCGLRRADQRVECWGANDRCQLGTCPGYLYETPTPLAAPVY